MNYVNCKRLCMEQKNGEDSAFWNEIYLRNERGEGLA